MTVITGAARCARKSASDSLEQNLRGLLPARTLRTPCWHRPAPAYESERHAQERQQEERMVRVRVRRPPPRRRTSGRGDSQYLRVAIVGRAEKVRKELKKLIEEGKLRIGYQDWANRLRLRIKKFVPTNEGK